MKSGILNTLSAISGKMTIVEWLNSTMFDELVEIDVINDEYRTANHAEDKFVNAPAEGTFSDLYQFTLDHLIHPDDYESYASFVNIDTIQARLDQPDSTGVPGIILNQLRFKRKRGGWRWVELCVIGGEQHGFAPGIIRLYTFSIEPLDNDATKDGTGDPNNLDSPQPYRDKKTGLLGEQDFFNKAEAVLAELNGPNWCVIAIDLDHFSLFNDWYGRKTGDELLARIGTELALAERTSGGLAGYLGQDNFCFFAPYEEKRIANLYNRLSALIAELATAIGFKPVFGISMTNGRTSFIDVFDEAKLAQEYADADYKTDICLFEADMREKSEGEYRILLDFQQGLAENEFVVYLQPQCRVSSGTIVGVEALTRWVKRDGTIVPPMEFIPALEKHGFITDLDCYIWERVCSQLREWLDGGHKAVPVSVNVSQYDFFTIDVAEQFARLIEKYDIPPSLLKIEITESAFAEGSSSIEEAITQLRTLGFTVLMDDFGSGYSSLNRLSNLNVDVIKLDANFLKMEGDDKRKDIHIVESIISMAKTMALPIICEGVETKEQVEFLDGLGCRYIQGFYFYRPMSSADFEKLIGNGDLIDDQGFVTKQNEQFRIKEFLDENVYSDTMLNTILGPVAYYLWHDDDIDIIRFNEQFYESVDVPNFNERVTSIQQFTPKCDVPKLFNLFERASQDQLNGASDIVGFYRTDGSLSRFMMRLYYLGESAEGKRFYGSVRDITEIAELKIQLDLLSNRLPTTILFMRQMNEKWNLRIIIHGLVEETGLTKDRFQSELDDGSFFDRLGEGEMDRLLASAHEAIAHSTDFVGSITLANGNGGTTHLDLEANFVQDSVGDASYVVKLNVR